MSMRSTSLVENHDIPKHGRSVPSSTNKYFDSFDPYTEQVWARVTGATAADVDEHVEVAAETGEGEWRRLTANAGGHRLRRLAGLVAAEAEALAVVETCDNGELINETRMQLNDLPQWFRDFGGLADRIEGRVIPIDKPGVVNLAREEPLGVAAPIASWNCL